MRILVIPDKFKGSLTADQAATAIRKGIEEVFPKAEVTSMSLSDGGEGFVTALASATGGRLGSAVTIDPMDRPCRARFGVCPDGTAVASIAEASGYWRVPAEVRNPGKWTVEGTGRLLAKLAGRGYQEIIVGFGGSITNEGGIGLAAPFGFHFLNRLGRPISLNGDGLARLAKIVPPPQLPGTRFVAATDVRNPLYGPEGAAFQFGAQKGAGPTQIRSLDDHLKRLADVAGESLGRSRHLDPGAGAAGGAAYGLMTFLKARRVSGFEWLATRIGLGTLIASQDLIITGEGCLDETSTQGKGPWEIAQLCLKAKKPVWMLCGVRRLAKERHPFARVGEIVGCAPNPEAARQRASFYLRRLTADLASDLFKK